MVLRHRSHARVFVLLLVGLLALPALNARAQDTGSLPDNICGPEQREAFRQLANDGVSPEELVEIFAHCRDTSNATSPAEEADAAKAIEEPGDQIIIVNNGLASTFYEQMNGCGYHPQLGVAACDIEIKQPFGFGPFGPPPFGSTEFVDFCYFCPTGVFRVQGTVHVTDDTTGVTPSWGMAAFGPVPTACGFPAGSGAPFTIAATLSWGAPAVNPCSAAPRMTWGNQIIFDTRDDP